MASAPFEVESAACQAGLLQAKGDYGAAEPLLRQVLDAQERAPGPDDPATLASVQGVPSAPAIASKPAEKGRSLHSNYLSH